MTGAMIIDITKSLRHRAGKVAAKMLDWQGWNNLNPLHPKGDDGRWVEGHPGVADLGEMPDHVHHLHDTDLAQARSHVESLRVAIEAEQSRRNPGDIRNAGVVYTPDRPRPKEDFSVASGSQEALAESMRIGGGRPALANPTKPLRAARAPRGDLEGIRANWAAAVERPMPSDRERFRKELSGLTLKQLEELNGGKLSGTNKADKINNLIEHRVGYRVNSEAIRHGVSAGSGSSDDRTRRLSAINADLHAADLRGDRAEYGRLHEERLKVDREMTGWGETPKGRPAMIDDTGNAQAAKRAQTKVDKIKERLDVERGKNRDQRRATQSEREMTLANDLRKAEDDLRETKRNAGTLPDTRGHAAPGFDITNKGQRESRINDLTTRINREANPDLRAQLRKERAELATWKEPGSRTRPKEPFTYPDETTERAMERHNATHAAATPGIERDRTAAEGAAGRIQALLNASRTSTTLPNEDVAKIVRDAKLNPRQMRFLADEFNVDLGKPPGGFGSAPKTKEAKILAIAEAIAGSHRRNPGGREHWR